MEQNIMQLVTGLMELAARTAPKTAGQDYIKTKIIGKKDLNRLANDMLEYGEKTNKKNYDRDARCVKESDAVLLIAISNTGKMGFNCGACGFDRCTAMIERKNGPEFSGPICAWRIIDLGIALGSAVKTASILNVDNRIMYRIGVVARNSNMIDGELVVGIPVSATGKNIYFDRS